ncbi:MAG: type II toxin-antitoxin system mRNA interferase toxin, RelE/StbE family [Patescibacteria group bacterium]|nr:type II toxin-antitoxin system mRNA interferase toxin, RelE/StbE family [Patescibacteria group bacterium]
MIVVKIKYSKKFAKQLKKLPKKIIKKAITTEKIFKINPLHSSLRMHELHGRLKNAWSISINKNYRIIFERQINGEITFISIGKHDIYNCL